MYFKELKSARASLEEERKLRKVQTDTIRVSLDLYYHYFVRLGLGWSLINEYIIARMATLIAKLKKSDRQTIIEKYRIALHRLLQIIVSE